MTRPRSKQLCEDFSVRFALKLHSIGITSIKYFNVRLTIEKLAFYSIV